MTRASVSDSPLLPPGGDPEEDPGHTGVTMSPSWPGNALGSSQKSWRKCPGRGKSGCPCPGSCPHNPAPDKRSKMDGWMDYVKLYTSEIKDKASLPFLKSIKLKRLSPEQTEDLSKDITNLEILSAISLKKAPGMDGFPIEF